MFESNIIDRLNDTLVADRISGLSSIIMNNENTLDSTFALIEIPMNIAYRQTQKGYGKLEKMMK